MRNKFQPATFVCRFEAAVIVYFALLFIIMQCPILLEAYVTRSACPWLRFGMLSGWAISFAAVNLLIYFMMKEQLLARVIVMVMSGMIMAFFMYVQSPGIINPVYFFIFSVACATTIGVYQGRFLFEQLEQVTSTHPHAGQALEYIRDSFKYLLSKAFQGWMAFGASLGVSMSILFRDGFEDVHIKFIALKMLIGFMGVTVATAYWIATPLVNGIISVQEKLILFGPRRVDQSSAGGV